MSKGSAPTPPNPIATAGAQTSSNVSTAVANAFLNNTNQTTPLGSLNYDQTSLYNFTDPTTGTTYAIPRFTATQQLTPQEQGIQDQSEAAKYNLANLSSTQSGRLGSLLGSPFDPSGAPPAGQVPGQYQATTNTWPEVGAISSNPWTELNPVNSNPWSEVGAIEGNPGDGGPIATSFGGTNQPITNTYGNPDILTDRSNVESSLFQRVQPQNARDLNVLQQQLADQGISYGSPAYQAAMDQYSRGINDQRLAITAQGGQEQALQENIAAQRAGFQNAAQQQDYQQQLGRGQFQNAAQQQYYNQIFQNAQLYNAAQQQDFSEQLSRGQYENAAQQQDFDEQLARGQFTNQAQAQDFSQNTLRGQFTNAAMAQNAQQAQQQYADQNAARQQYLQELYAQRNQPLNEISALLSGSQIQQPGFLNTPQSQIPTTDVAGLINQNFNQNFQNYQQQVSQSNNLIGGILGAAGNVGRGLIASDVRVKKDIHRIGTVFAGTPQPVADVQDADSGENSMASETKKLPIYSYAYKEDPSSTQHVGPMAQDVEKIDPAAVRSIGGVKHIDTRRVMGGILKAA
jgi:hypothetical protein